MNNLNKIIEDSEREFLEIIKAHVKRMNNETDFGKDMPTPPYWGEKEIEFEGISHIKQSLLKAYRVGYNKGYEKRYEKMVQNLQSKNGKANKKQLVDLSRLPKRKNTPL